MSESTRYQALNDSIFTARGEDILIDIAGPERLSLQTESIAPESACTSMQLHLQVSPAEFARNWNAAQVLAGPQLALGANSPYFFGHQLWSETRIELFTQATDTRPDELKTQGVRPRVWFGERWITSIFDLFEENVRYFPSLLPELSDEDPVAELAAGRTPRLSELRLHNGTIYRWNRPVYDVVDGRPHLRVENRVLPAGPTVVDMMANSAFYYGVLRALSEEDRPLWTKMSFAAAQHNFVASAEHGMEARLYWPGLGEVTPDELVLRQLLPMADEGLRRWGVATEVRERYLGVIEGRAKTGHNGATWQVSTVRALQERGLTRPNALAEMLRLYCERMHSNEPVHTWVVKTVCLLALAIGTGGVPEHAGECRARRVQPERGVRPRRGTAGVDQRREPEPALHRGAGGLTLPDRGRLLLDRTGAHRGRGPTAGKCADDNAVQHQPRPRPQHPDDHGGRLHDRVAVP